MTLPRILVIDDQCANQAFMRESVFGHCNLVEIDLDTSDSEVERIRRPDSIAAAVFSSGQIKRETAVENSMEEVLRVVKSGWPSVEGWRWALILLDLQFDSTPSTPQDGRFGLEVLKELVRRFPDFEAQVGNSEVPIVMLSTVAKELIEREAGKYGALAYIEKPELTRAEFKRLLNHHGLIEDSDGLLVGKSYGLLKVLRDARRIASMNSGNALILGPQGSGKTSIARYIHNQSGRDKTGPFIEHVSRPAVKELEYSELFGCWKGAHNEAKVHSGGKVEQAHMGTLLIDEVQTLNAMNQEELLQFGRLRNGKREVRRLGNFPKSDLYQAQQSVKGDLNKATSVITVDVLVLSATNAPLDVPAWRAERGFSEALYTRLATEYAGRPLRFPSLAERRDDIPLLFEKFVNMATEEFKGRTYQNGKKSIEPEAMERIKDYSWPGNVADLYGFARAVASNSQEFPDVFERHLPPFPRSDSTPIPVSVPVPPPPSSSTHNNLDEALRMLGSVQVPHSREALYGRLQSFQDAYGQLIKQLCEVALEETSPVEPGPLDKRPYVPALKLLYGQKMTAGQANSKLLQLKKMFWKDNPPAAGSPLAIAISRAGENRNPNSSDDEDS